MAAPHYKTLLAQMQEVLPDAQFSRDLYFHQKAQAALLPAVLSPGMTYLERVHLFAPPPGRVNYTSPTSLSLDQRLGESYLKTPKKTESNYFIS